MKGKYVLVHHLITYIAWLLPLCLQGQQPVVISGTITDSLGTPLQGASVILNSEEGRALKFAISNSKGAYSIPVESVLQTFTIHVRKLNYASALQTVANETQTAHFTLRPETTMLREVSVNAGPITQHGDTISYQVSEFAEGSDRSIGDVLSKMPGIEIQGDGKVLYQGKPINRYYIEGMDLLEGRYGLANKNLPHQSLSSVQVLENHQPLQVLDSLVPSHQAALNIKLKNNVAVTGTAQLGAGASPLLWAANITPMLFTKKHQMIASYQANNIGNDVSVQLKALTMRRCVPAKRQPMDK